MNAFLVTLVLVFCLSFLIGLTGDIAHSDAGFDGALLVATYTTFLGAGALVVWGLPVHFLLVRMNKTKIYCYAIAGITPGFIFVFILSIFGEDETFGKILQFIPLAFVGAACASLFGYIANATST